VLSQGEPRDAAVNVDTYRVQFPCHSTAFLLVFVCRLQWIICQKVTSTWKNQSDRIVNTAQVHHVITHIPILNFGGVPVGPDQGHREFPFWKPKIPPALSVKIPENSRYENTPIYPVCKRKFIKIVIYLPLLLISPSPKAFDSDQIRWVFKYPEE